MRIEAMLHRGEVRLVRAEAADDVAKLARQRLIDDDEPVLSYRPFEIEGVNSADRVNAARVMAIENTF